MPQMFDMHVFEGAKPGPRLLILGAVHGNEVCGAIAIARVLDELSRGELRIEAGRVTLVPVVNRLAHERKQRTGDRNLNRDLFPKSEPQDNEDRIANELCPLLADHEVLLDLHSFHSPGEPFVMLGPKDNGGTIEPFSHAADEEAFAARLGVSLAVDGWMESYAAGAARRGDSLRYGVGTTEYMRTVGGWGVTLECGQHDDPRSPEVAYRAVRNALAHLQLVEAPPPARVEKIQTLRLCEVVDRADAGDRFAKDWTSFQPVKQGEPIGWRANGDALDAPSDGFIVFPNAKALPGAEWYYFALASGRL
jgi:predicted deacylase